MPQRVSILAVAVLWSLPFVVPAPLAPSLFSSPPPPLLLPVNPASYGQLAAAVSPLSAAPPPLGGSRIVPADHWHPPSPPPDSPIAPLSLPVFQRSPFTARVCPRPRPPPAPPPPKLLRRLIPELPAQAGTLSFGLGLLPVSVGGFSGPWATWSLQNSSHLRASSRGLWGDFGVSSSGVAAMIPLSVRGFGSSGGLLHAFLRPGGDSSARCSSPLFCCSHQFVS